MINKNKKTLYSQLLNYNPQSNSMGFVILRLYREILKIINILTIYISLSSYIYIYED